jgi:hypothetical protein
LYPISFQTSWAPIGTVTGSWNQSPDGPHFEDL